MSTAMIGSAPANPRSHHGRKPDRPRAEDGDAGADVTGFRRGDHVVLSYQSCGQCRACKAGCPAEYFDDSGALVAEHDRLRVSRLPESNVRMANAARDEAHERLVIAGAFHQQALDGHGAGRLAKCGGFDRMRQRSLLSLDCRSNC
jgi:hypothetical protein